MPDDTDPAAQLAAMVDAVANLDALLDLAAARGIEMPGALRLLHGTLADADRLAASLVGDQPMGPEAGEA
jgi:hypothetical protein